MENQVKQEKMYKVTIVFNRSGSTVFGGVMAQEISMVVSAGTKKELLEMFYSQKGVFSITLSDGSVRHVNALNILYIDEKEIAVQDGGKNE